MTCDATAIVRASSAGKEIIRIALKEGAGAMDSIAPSVAADAIDSWRRTINKADADDKSSVFEYAASELMGRAKRTDPISRQGIVDAVAEMGEIAGVDPDKAQAVMSGAVSKVSRRDVPIHMSHGVQFARRGSDST